MLVFLSAWCGVVATPALRPLRAPTGRLSAGSSIRMGSLFAEPSAEEAAAEQHDLRVFTERDSRLKLVAERYGLNPETDGLQIAARAASSLPEEECAAPVWRVSSHSRRLSPQPSARSP